MSVKVLVTNETASKNVFLHRNQSIINKGGLSSVASNFFYQLTLAVKIVNSYQQDFGLPLLASVLPSICPLFSVTDSIVTIRNFPDPQIHYGGRYKLPNTNLLKLKKRISAATFIPPLPFAQVSLMCNLHICSLS